MQWGQNSGHVGVPLENIPAFVQRLQSMYQKTTGQTLKSPGSKPKATIAKGGKAAKEQKNKEARGKKKEPAVKPTMDDLDADLVNYTSQRNADVPDVTDAPVAAS